MFMIKKQKRLKISNQMKYIKMKRNKQNIENEEEDFLCLDQELLRHRKIIRDLKEKNQKSNGRK